MYNAIVERYTYKYDYIERYPPFSQDIKKVHENIDDRTYGVCSNYIEKITVYSFTSVYKQQISIHNFVNSSAIKKQI